MYHLTKGTTMSNTTKRARVNSRIGNLNKCLSDLDCKFKDYEELLMIRRRIAAGSMTDELYKFLNVNGSLETLLRGLPMAKDVPESAQEDLQNNQIVFVDTAIENILTTIRDAIVKLWNYWKEWVKDWVITNRRLKFYLRRHLTRLKAYSFDYGDPATFNKIEAVIYRYTEWSAMLRASKSLSSLMDNITPNTPAKYFQTHFREFKQAFDEFGYKFTDTAIVRDDPKYLRRKLYLGTGGAGWNRTALVDNVTSAMSNLQNEENASRKIINVDRAFKYAVTTATDANDLNALKWLVAMCKYTEEAAGVVARGVLDVCNAAKRGA